MLSLLLLLLNWVLHTTVQLIPSIFRPTDGRSDTTSDQVKQLVSTVNRISIILNIEPNRCTDACGYLGSLRLLWFVFLLRTSANTYFHFELFWNEKYVNTDQMAQVTPLLSQNEFFAIHWTGTTALIVKDHLWNYQFTVEPQIKTK